MSFRFGLYFLSIILLGLLFEIAEPIEDRFFKDQYLHWFLFSDASLRFSSYVYYTVEHAIPLFIALIVVNEVPQARFYASVYCYLQFIDTLDFWATANGLWVDIGGWPITFNIIRVLIFVMLLTYGIIRTIITSRFAS